MRENMAKITKFDDKTALIERIETEKVSVEWLKQQIETKRRELAEMEATKAELENAGLNFNDER
jgi:hypothetical protein